MERTIPNIAALDLFCGIGGLTKGLELSGIKVAAGFDIDDSCSFIYDKNTESKFVKCDVSELTQESLNSYYPGEARIKILVGCAPCQPFSRLSGKYRRNGYKDDKWKLLYSFGQLIKTGLPDVVSMENVPDIEKTDILKDFILILEQNNYTVFAKTVYCPDYGVPQKRKRFVLLASRHGKIELVPPKYTRDTYRTVRDAIGNLPPIAAGEQDPFDPMHRACSLSYINLERIRQSVPGGTWMDWKKELVGKCHQRKSGATFPSVYGRMQWDEPSPTITTQFFGYGNGRFGHPEQDRAISLREGAILQSFPYDYIFCDDSHPISFNKMGMHIGNAVPVELGRAIGESIINHLCSVNLIKQGVLNDGN